MAIDEIEKLIFDDLRTNNPDNADIDLVMQLIRDPTLLDQHRDEMTDQQYWELKYRLLELPRLANELAEAKRQHSTDVAELAEMDQQMAEVKNELRQHGIDPDDVA